MDALKYNMNQVLISFFYFYFFSSERLFVESLFSRVSFLFNQTSVNDIMKLLCFDFGFFTVLLPTFSLTGSAHEQN